MTKYYILILASSFTVNKKDISSWNFIDCGKC